MNRPNPAPEPEAARLEEYLLALRRNPAAKPSGELDPALAHVARLTSDVERSDGQTARQNMEAARSRVWQAALASLETEKVQSQAGTAAQPGFVSLGNSLPESHGDTQTGPVYGLPEPLRKTRQINWPRLVLTGMAATVAVIVGVFGLLLFTQGQQTPSNPVGSGGTITTAAQTANPTANATASPVAQVTPTQPPQPTPTPFPAYKLTLSIQNQVYEGSQATATGQVLEARMQVLGVSYAKASINGNQIILEVRGVPDMNAVKQVAIIPGRVEFVAVEDKTIKVGDRIETTYCLSGSLLESAVGLCDQSSPHNNAATPTYIYVPAGKKDKNGNPFQTIVTGEDTDLAGIKKIVNSVGNYGLQIKFKPEAATVMKNFTGSHLGQQMAVTLDNEVAVAATIQGVISDTAEITSPTDLVLTNFLAVLKSGPLPLSLTLVNTTGP